jgi:predicted RND superfamily exporter protein
VSDRGRVNNLLVEAKSDEAVDPRFLSFLKLLQIKLSPVSDVVSLAEVDNITSTEWGLKVDPPMDTVPQTEEALNQLAATVFENEMFVTGLVSEDSTATAILVELSFWYDDYLDVAHAVFNRLQSLVQPYREPEQIRLAGVPMVNVYVSNAMSQDLSKLTPLVILLVIIVMYLSFRMLKGVFIPLSVVLVSLVWTLGIMGIVGRPITMIVSMMPIMLIAIGIADGIHIITEYKLVWTKLRNRERAILKTMQQLTVPVVFTSLTTMAGFASLASSGIRSIRDFGIFTSVGVFAAMTFSLVFIPAALKLMKPPEPHFGGAKVDQGGLTRVLTGLANLAIQRRRWVFVTAVVLGVLSVLTLTQLKVGSRMAGLFREDSEIYQASQMLNEKFGGTEVMNIVVDTKRKDGLKDPQILGKIAALQDTLESMNIVGYSSSLADYVRRINLVMNDSDPAFNRVPHLVETAIETEWAERDGEEVEVRRQVQVDGRDLISQYMLLYENAGGTYLEKLADYDYSKANIIALLQTDDSPLMRKVKQRAETFTEQNFGSDVEVTYAGCSTLCIVADGLIIPGQLKSLGIALVVVLALLMLGFRSLKYGLIGILPLALTVLFVFGAMSAAGVYLDAAMALVASIVLGIGVDYSVHFLSRYRSLRRQGIASRQAIGETFRTSGRAIVFNSVAVAMGFSVLLLSSFWPVINLGWLVAANMVLSAALTMILLTGIVYSISRKEKELNSIIEKEIPASEKETDVKVLE